MTGKLLLYPSRATRSIRLLAVLCLGSTLLPLQAAEEFVPVTDEMLQSPADGDFPADATSFGYRTAMRLDYNNAVGAVNLFPYVQWQHDVNGNSPAPIGPFVDDRTALTLGLRADYLSRWQANVGYTRYGGWRNELADRDFISASVKYSF